MTNTSSMEKLQPIAIRQLHFDRDNPRIQEWIVSPREPEVDIIKTLWDHMDVRELVQSIAANGYFDHEVLLAEPMRGKEGFVVIEGNRRLAAVRVLLDPSLIKTSIRETIPDIGDALREKLQTLPVIVTNRAEAWRYIGFKHVNGPARWTSIAKAEYINYLHHELGIPLDQIAEQLGDRHRVVQRLYRGLRVFLQAENEKLYDREDRTKPRFALSHLYTGLEKKSFQKFLNLASEGDESDSPVPESHFPQLKQLCHWLWGSRSEGKESVISSQNPDLKHLAEVLDSREALASLREDNNLAAAFNHTIAPSALLEDSLLLAKRSLQQAMATLSGGFKGETDLLDIAKDTHTLARDLYESMEGKSARMHRARRELE